MSMLHELRKERESHLKEFKNALDTLQSHADDRGKIISKLNELAGMFNKAFEFDTKISGAIKEEISLYLETLSSLKTQFEETFSSLTSDLSESSKGVCREINLTISKNISELSENFDLISQKLVYFKDFSSEFNSTMQEIVENATNKFFANLAETNAKHMEELGPTFSAFQKLLHAQSSEINGLCASLQDQISTNMTSISAYLLEQRSTLNARSSILGDTLSGLENNLKRFDMLIDNSSANLTRIVEVGEAGLSKISELARQSQDETSTLYDNIVKRLENTVMIEVARQLSSISTSISEIKDEISTIKEQTKKKGFFGK